MTTNAPQARIQRQIVLPISKAVEIAYKSIRLRLSRSLLVTSGIVLALAFLMSVLCSDAMISAMRKWASEGAGSQIETARTQRDALVQHQAALSAKLHIAAEKPADPERLSLTIEHVMDDHAATSDQVGPLPMPEPDLVTAMNDHGEVRSFLAQWIDVSKELKQVKDQLTAPQQIEALMKSNGVPTTSADIASSKTQTRWLIGLALLVAFVGILNAMLMSVTERFREIGTMKCLGALDSFIIKLFLIESFFQGVVGTIIGVILGFAASAFSMWSTYGEYAWIDFPALAVLRAAVVCLLIGMGLTVAGAVYPAWQAARMQPIEAMRVET